MVVGDVFGREQRAARAQGSMRILSQASRVYVLPVKLAPEEVSSIEAKAASLGAVVCGRREDANLLLTELRAPMRIKRHTSEEERRHKWIVATDWLDACEGAGVHVDPRDYLVWSKEKRDGGEMQKGAGLSRGSESAEKAGQSAAEDGLKEDLSTPVKGGLSPSEKPRTAKRTTPASSSQVELASSPLGEASTPESSNDSRASTPTHKSKTKRVRTEVDSNDPSTWPAPPPLNPPGAMSTQPPKDAPDEYTEQEAWDRAPSWCNSEYAVLRPTPLHSAYNQPLVDELQLLRTHRRLTNDEHSEMAYMRAAASVKAVPFSLAPLQVSQLKELKGVGRKMAILIEQFYSLGHIPEAETIRNDEAIRTIMQLNELYSVGPKSAERAYNEGCRTLEDLTRRHKTVLSSRLGAEESLRLLPDLEQPMDALEAEQIAADIVAAINKITPDCSYVIAGGFRRGKRTSRDVDMIVTHAPDRDASPASVLRKLVEQLQSGGRVSHTVSIPGRPPLDDSASRVEVAELVYLSDASGQLRHRRVDIVFARRPQYGAALLGWTGSVLYERDLRRWARRAGYTFGSSGLHRLSDGALIDTPSEASIYTLLGLPRMPPRLRNAD